MTDRIEVRGLRVRGWHGVLPDERRTGQVFVVDAVLDVNLAPAAASDALSDTVDYAALATALADVVAGEPFHLIETLAARLADVCLADDRVGAVEVTVRKPEAPLPIPVDEVAVTIRRVRG